MAELRAPDPTLTAWLGSREPGCGLVVLDGWSGAEPSNAHRLGPTRRSRTTACGRRQERDPGFDAPTQDARWFAIPCRECFPEAPPRGYSLQDDSCGEGCSYRTWQPDPHLEWQVPHASR